MRFKIFAFLALVCGAGPAAAQTSISLAAEPVAIIDAEINNRPVRLEVDPRMPDVLVLSTAAAERLGVRRAPMVAARVSIEEGSSIRGRLARPRIVFGGRAARNLAGIFPAPVTSRADGVIGPGSLPFDQVTLTLAPDAPSTRDIVFALDDPDSWTVRASVGGETLELVFDVANDASVLNRPAVRLFDSRGAIPVAGDLIERPVMLGLSTLMQPVSTELSVEGIALGPTFARTAAPLLGALEEDAFVIEGEATDQTPELTLGRRALADAGCSSIKVDRRTRQLTLRCAA